MAILRRIKEKLRNAAPKKIALKKKQLKTPTQTATAEIKKEMGAEKLTIEKTKFSHPETPSVRKVLLEDLPHQYGQEKIVLQVRDPYWIHAYWEIRDSTLERLKNDLGQDFFQAKRCLRVYDISQIIFNGSNAHRFFDLEINEFANNWYIDTGGPGRSWCIDYGLRLASGRFITIVRSNTVQAPLEGPSWITDEEWMIPEDMFARLYGMGFGLGQSSPVGRAWQQRAKLALFSGALGSGGITSLASPVKKLPQEKKFHLAVDCELIIYGSTEANAKVTVQGKPIKLRQDGSFSLRFALPDGRQVIPVKAVSCDNAETHSITPIITRETK